jgi:nucleoid DNA-binding protein
MATLQDILFRTAASLGMQASELEPYAAAMLHVIHEARERGEDVELMTFGKLRFGEDKEAFLPHTSLLPPQEGEQK